MAETKTANAKTNGNAQRKRTSSREKSPSVPPAPEPEQAPEGVQEAPPEPPEQLPDCVVCYVTREENGNVSVRPQAMGDVRITEVREILLLGRQKAGELLGLED